VTGKVDQIARRGEDVFGAPRRIETRLGQRNLAGAALDQFGPYFALQLADLHGQRRLADGAILRGPAEMPVTGQRG
jgi:hypothetical protein